MSWLEKYNTDFTITCGDGRTYKVGWMNATLAVAYNLAEFEYNNISGAYVPRKNPKANRYNLEIHFQGEDHLDTAESFRLSSANPAPWQLQHPLYGKLNVQPTSLLFDNSGYNITVITGTVIETITDGQPIITVSPEDTIITAKETADLLLTETFSAQVQLKAADISTLSTNNAQMYNEGKKSVPNTLNAEGYTNAFNKAQSAVNKITTEPITAMTQLQALINYPSQFQERVKNRLSLFTTQFAQLRNTIQNIITRNGKKIFEHQGGTMVGAMAQTTITNTEKVDYNNRTLVTNTIESLLDAYNGYIDDLGTLQTDNGAGPDSYIPDFDSINALSTLVNYTVGNLFRIADNSRQQHTIVLDEDTNPISLAHRLYGLKPDDSTISELLNTNKIGLEEPFFILRKGRSIVYYV